MPAHDGPSLRASGHFARALASPRHAGRPSFGTSFLRPKSIAIASFAMLHGPPRAALEGIWFPMPMTCRHSRVPRRGWMDTVQFNAQWWLAGAAFTTFMAPAEV